MAKLLPKNFKNLLGDQYYLLAFDDKSQAMRTYRVDRMKAVKPTGEPRDGQEEFDALDLQNYTQRVFGMFGGKRVRVTLRFTNDLLDSRPYRTGSESLQATLQPIYGLLFSYSRGMKILLKFLNPCGQ